MKLFNGSDKIACPYCKADSFYFLKGKDYNRKISSICFKLYRCSSCNIIFLVNLPENMDAYYPGDYHNISQTIQDLEPSLALQKSKIDLLLPFKSDGKLLEIGPSIGVFCALAKRNNFDVSAIEMNGKCVDFLNDKLKINALQSYDPAETIAKQNIRYDAICMWHSLEHIPNPFQLLNECIKSLNNGGILLIAVPNPLSWQAGILKKWWPHYDLPRHLFAFPIGWFRKFANDNNLKVEMVTTTDKDGIYWNRFSWAMLLRPLGFFLRTNKKNSFFDNCIKWSSIFSKWDDREGLGACYTIILRKQ